MHYCGYNDDNASYPIAYFNTIWFLFSYEGSVQPKRCTRLIRGHTVYPKKYAHGFVVLCFVVVMQSFIMNSHGVFIHIHLGCFAGTGAIVRLPQCQWSKPDGYGKISQCITTTKHSKAKTVCIFLGIYCISTQPTKHILLVVLCVPRQPRAWFTIPMATVVMEISSFLSTVASCSLADMPQASTIPI